MIGDLVQRFFFGEVLMATLICVLLNEPNKGREKNTHPANFPLQAQLFSLHAPMHQIQSGSEQLDSSCCVKALVTASMCDLA